VTQQGTILVVDDDKFNVALMRELCETAGYEVLEALDGDAAIEKAVSARPDLILLDIMMQGKDGFEVCRELRARPETVEIPVILVTALDDLDSMARGIHLGADDYVTKPFRLFELQQRVHTAIESRRYRRLLREAEQKLDELGDTDSPGGVGGYRQLRNGLDYEFKRAVRYDHPLSCLLLTIDDFDKLTADAEPERSGVIATEVVGVLKQFVRVVDRIYQLHDDEFILLLPETPRSGARVAIDRIRQGVRERPQQQQTPITVTAALVSYPHPAIKTSQDVLLSVNQLHRIAAERGGDTVLEIEE